MSPAFLQCMDESCRRRHSLDKRECKCEACGSLLDVKYEFAPADPGTLRQIWERRKSSKANIDQSGVWRFREILPFVPAGKEIVSLAEGRTPLVEVSSAGEWAGAGPCGASGDATPTDRRDCR